MDKSNGMISTFMPDFKNPEELAEKTMLGSCLFGTIVSDVYSKDEANNIYVSLKTICGNDHSKPFDTYGIYCYWDFYTKEILYIGLSKDLVSRFAQHNNINSKSTKGNKSLKIREYFKSKDKLGFSILLQPPIIQSGFNLFDKDREVKFIESALFQSYINQYGRIPLWNIVEGYKKGRDKKIVHRYGDILDMLNFKKVGFLNAKSLLRELSENLTFQDYECDLNLIRAHMYQWKESFEKVTQKLINFNNSRAMNGDFDGNISNMRLKNMLNSSYHKKEINAL